MTKSVEETPKDKKKTIMKAAKQSKTDSVYPEKEKDKKTGETKTDKSQIPKDALVKGLAKELYKAQYAALTLQSEIDKALDAMTKADPEDPKIAQATASGALQVANAQLRADTIEQQMIAAAGDNPKLVLTATELAAEAKNLAMKKGLEVFGDIVKKWIKDAEAAVKDKKSDKESEKEEDSKK